MRSSKQKSKRPLLAILLIVAVVVAVYFLIWKPSTRSSNQPSQQPVSQSGAASSQVNYGPPSDAEKQARDQQKQDILKQQSVPSGASPSAPATPPQTITATISRASQPSAGQPLAVRVNIAGTTTGECDIALSKDGQPTINKVFPVAFQATTSSCQGSDVAAGEFPAGGDWSLQVIVKNGSSQSTPVNQTVTISK